MSEETKLTPSDFEELKELLDFMREMGRDKLQVMKLTLNFRNVLYKLGYSDKDTISIQEIEKALSTNLWSMKNQPTKNVELSKEDTITDQFDSGRNWSAGSENGRNWSEIDFDRNSSCFAFKPFNNFVLKLFVFQELLNKGIHNVLESNVPLKFSTPLPLEFYQLLLVFRSNSHKFSPRHLLHQTNAYRLLNINVCLTAKRPKSLNLNLLNNLTVKQFSRWWA